MKNKRSYWKMSAGLAGAALALLCSLSSVQAAAAPAINGYLTLRPLTPTEIKTYGLTNPAAQFSAGLTTVGIGEPVYLEALVNVSSTLVVTNATWTVTSRPAGSTVTNTAFTSPLGTNLPVYKSADQKTYKVGARAMFRPDVVGFYTIGVKLDTAGSGSTNLSITVVGANYLGITACAACHSGSFSGVPSIYPSYTNTAHASFFARAIDGVESSHYGKNCISCHVVGYDTNSFAVNGGFDDMAATLGWTFPTVLTNGNWANMPEQLKDLANIQCENCHGPGSQHMYSQSTVGNTNAITVTLAAADCGQCHDSLTGHSHNAEWNISLHANATRSPSGTGRQFCVRCHTAGGFIAWANAGGQTNQNAHPLTQNYTPNTDYEAITCQACHDPHDASNGHQLRMGYNITLSDGTVVTNAGSGGFCMQCHNSRNGSVTNQMALYPLNQTNWPAGVGFGTHDSPQGDMLEGANAVTYGKVIPSSPHANVVSNTCAGCHMQAVASTDPAFLKAGAHTFKMSYTNSLGAVTPLTTVCAQCHGKLTTFDFPVADYNGDGRIDGVQTEVQSLMNKLSTLMPAGTWRADGNYVADGLVKSPKTFTNMPAKFLNAAYNYQFVNMDGSLGVHNAAFAVGLLKASIADLSGDANNDGLPDAWQTQYFGSNFATNPAAAYNATNSTGMPNWLVASLGISPFGAFKVSGNSGVVYFNGSSIVNGATNTIAIYTAAEIAFNTQSGVNYQIQGVSSLSGGWQNIGTNIVGNGSSVSYVTPTRGNVQMFYRVVSQ